MIDYYFDTAFGSVERSNGIISLVSLGILQASEYFALHGRPLCSITLRFLSFSWLPNTVKHEVLFFQFFYLLPAIKYKGDLFHIWDLYLAAFLFWSSIFFFNGFIWEFKNKIRAPCMFLNKTSPNKHSSDGWSRQIPGRVTTRKVVKKV